MIIFPAIDLKDGRCVRLRQGDMAQATIFNDDPAAQARAFETAGFEYLHLVDLNGAFAGHSVNTPAIRAILSAIKIPLQLGGGIRDREAIESWLAAGVARVILGTVAVSDPALVSEAARAHPGRIAVGIDARNGKVAVKGWAEEFDRIRARAREAFRGCGRRCDYFYRHQPRRNDGRRQRRIDRGLGESRFDPGYRKRWCEQCSGY